MAPGKFNRPYVPWNEWKKLDRGTQAKLIQANGGVQVSGKNKKGAAHLKNRKQANPAKGAKTPPKGKGKRPQQPKRGPVETFSSTGKPPTLSRSEPSRQPTMCLKANPVTNPDVIQIVRDLNQVNYTRLYSGLLALITEYWNNIGTFSTVPLQCWFYWQEIIAFAAQGRTLSGMAPKLIADIAASIRPKLIRRGKLWYSYTCRTYCASAGDQSTAVSAVWTFPTPGAGAAANLEVPLAKTTTAAGTGYYTTDVGNPSAYVWRDMEQLHTQLAGIWQTVDLATYKSPYLNDPSVFAQTTAIGIALTRPQPQDIALGNAPPFVARLETPITTPWLAALGLMFVQDGGFNYSVPMMSDPGSVIWGYHKYGSTKAEWKKHGVPPITNIVVKPVFLDDLLTRFGWFVKNMVAQNGLASLVSPETLDWGARILMNYAGLIQLRTSPCGMGLGTVDSGDNLGYDFRMPCTFGNCPVNLSDLRMPKFFVDNVARLIPKVVGFGRNARLVVPTLLNSVIASTAYPPPKALGVGQTVSANYFAAASGVGPVQFVMPTYVNNYYRHTDLVAQTGAQNLYLRSRWDQLMSQWVGMCHISEMPREVSMETSIMDVSVHVSKLVPTEQVYAISTTDTDCRAALEIARHFSVPIAAFFDTDISYQQVTRWMEQFYEDTLHQCAGDEIIYSDLSGAASMYAFAKGTLGDWDSTFLVPDGVAVTGPHSRNAAGAGPGHDEQETERLLRMWGGGAPPAGLPRTSAAYSAPINVSDLVRDLQVRNKIEAPVVDRILRSINQEDKEDLDKIKWLLSWFPYIRYGKYGGPGYSAGTTDPPALEPGAIWSVPPDNDLDRLFLVHDVQYSKAGGDPRLRREADMDLVNGIGKLTDPPLYGRLAAAYFRWKSG